MPIEAVLYGVPQWRSAERWSTLRPDGKARVIRVTGIDLEPANLAVNSGQISTDFFVSFQFRPVGRSMLCKGDAQLLLVFFRRRAVTGVHFQFTAGEVRAARSFSFQTQFGPSLS